LPPEWQPGIAGNAFYRGKQPGSRKLYRSNGRGNPASDPFPLTKAGGQGCRNSAI